MILQKYSLNMRMVLNVCYFMIISSLIGCNLSQEKSIDVSKIKVNFKTVHFYKELYAIDTNDIENGLNNLGNKYPDFTSIFFDRLTGYSSVNNKDTFLKSVKHFLTYKDYRNLYDTVCQMYSNTNQLDKELETLFKHIKYYYPEEKWGTVYYFISGLNKWSAVTVDTILGIGLDMHLGRDYPYYPSVGLALYETENCEPKYIVINASKTIFRDKFPFDIEGKTLLEMMINKGMEMTFAAYTLPDTPDDLLMGYTPAQLKWCNDNERMIWSYFKKQNLLFSTQLQQVMRYTLDGPSSTGMPPEAPGNIGTWIGWQIVKKYLKENPDVKWHELAKKKIDAQVFLSASKYKP